MPRTSTRVELLEAVRYRVSLGDPGSHELEVQMDVPALPERASAEIVFPAWAPGSYMVRDFARHVYRLDARDRRARPLAMERLDKQRWRITTGGAPFTVRYRVFAFEATVRTSFFDDSHAYWNGTSVFFYVDGETARPARVEVARPRGWQVSTALPPAVAASGARTAALATFAAQDYDELVDSPFEVGTHERHLFREGGARFELCLYGRCNADRRRLVDILRKVVRATAAMFGGGFPFDRYLFIVHALPVGSGGLEHRASVTMDIAGLSFEDDKGYVRFADLAAHEFFHAWNVKRIHDVVLGPFDYTRENHTRLLWFHEGFTDYLANVLILRAGVIAEGDFWRFIADDWPRYAGRPGRNETPLDELSFEAWIKLYKPADNHLNRTVSYYEKGLWVGMALDLELRLRSGGRRGLPELFRRIWQRGRRKDDIPVTEADVRAAAVAVVGPRQGRFVDRFFDRFIHGTDELPLLPLLRRAGLSVREVPPWSSAAGEGDPVRRRRARSWSGVDLHPVPTAGGDRALVRNVVPDSPAAAAGLTFGDEIVAVGGDRVGASSFARRLGDHPPGRAVSVSYFRRDRLRHTELVVGSSPARKLLVEPAPRAPALALAVRRGWLGTRARAPRRP